MVLNAKIAAVWRWADTVTDGQLGPIELQRLSDAAGIRGSSADTKLEEVCKALGVDRADDVSIGEEAFASACQSAASNNMTIDGRRKVEEWFEKLQLSLVQQRGGSRRSAALPGLPNQISLS